MLKRMLGTLTLCALLAACGKGSAGAGTAAGGAAPAESATGLIGTPKPAGGKLTIDQWRGAAAPHDSVMLAIIKAPADSVTEQILKDNPNRIIKLNALDKTVEIQERSYLVVQLKGHPWSTVVSVGEDAQPADKMAQALSTLLQVPGMSLEYRSPGHTQFRYFDRGDMIERLDTADIESINSELEIQGRFGHDPEVQNRLASMRDHQCVWWESSLRPTGPTSNNDTHVFDFLNRLFKAEDAYLVPLNGVENGRGDKYVVELNINSADLEKVNFVAGH